MNAYNTADRQWQPNHLANIRLFKSQSLGKGAYGMVCRAMRDNLPCAAKLLHPLFFQSGDPGVHSTARKFDLECQFLSTLRHPNIVQYLGTYYDPESGLPVLLMELMDESLTRFLEQSKERLPYHTQVDLCHDIALALAYLHSNGIIHRDLSSNNVLLIAGSRAKVTDFGMSKLIDSNPRSTPLTQCPGTLVYMAPEATLDPPRYTEKLDNFSYGVLTIQILSRTFPRPTAKSQLVSDPRSPTGMVQFPIEEVVRRKQDIDSISPAHPLLLIALDCLRDFDRERPTAAELCQRVIFLKGTQEYTSSQQEPQFSSGHLRERIYAMSDQISELKQQNHSKDNEIHHLRQQLERVQVEERERKAQLMQAEHQTRHWYEKSREELSKVTTLQAEVQQLGTDKQVQMNQVERLRTLVDLRDVDLREERERIAQMTQEVAALKDQRREWEVGEMEAQHQLLLREREIEALRVAVQEKGEGEPVVRRAAAEEGNIDLLGQTFQVHWSKSAPPPHKSRLLPGSSTIKGTMLYISELCSRYIFTFDSVRDAWSTLPLCPQEGSSLVVIENLLTAVGGQDLKSKKVLGRLCSFAEHRSTNGGAWTQVFPPMLTERLWPAVLCAGNNLVAAGGKTWSEGEELNSVEILNTKVCHWCLVSNLPKPLCRMTLSLVEDNLYVTSGSIASSSSAVVFVCSFTALIQSYGQQSMGSLGSPTVWRTVANVPCVGSAFVVFANCLLCVGGEGKADSSVHVYNHEMNHWDLVRGLKLPHACSNPVAGVIGDHLVVVGGSDVQGDAPVVTPYNLVDIATFIPI